MPPLRLPVTPERSLTVPIWGTNHLAWRQATHVTQKGHLVHRRFPPPWSTGECGPALPRFRRPHPADQPGVVGAADDLRTLENLGQEGQIVLRADDLEPGHSRPRTLD